MHCALLLVAAALSPGIALQTQEPEEPRAASESAQELAQLAGRPMSGELVAVLEDLHHRAWGLGDVATAHAAIDRIAAWWAETHDPTSTELALLCNELGIRLHRLGDLAGARPLYERALAIREAVLDPEDLDLAESLHNLSLAHTALADYGAALRLLERELVILEAVHEPGHLDVAENLNCQGIVLFHLEDQTGARTLFERALEIMKDALGPEHAKVAHARSNLAIMLYKLEDYRAARTLVEEALAFQEDDPRTEPRDLAVSYDLLGTLLWQLGDVSAAREPFERSLEVRERALGPVHPTVADSLQNLASLFYSTGDFAAAQPLAERGLAIVEKAYGPEHPDVAGLLVSLADILVSRGDLAAARPLMERGLRIQEATLGPGHSHVARSLNNLGLLIRQQGDLAAARPLLERALAIGETAFGPDDRETVRTFSCLAWLCLDMRDAAAAWSRASRYVQDRETIRRTLASLTEGESYLYLARQLEHIHTVLALAEATGNQGAVYDTVLRSKGQVARLTLQLREQLREETDPETSALRVTLGELQTRLSRLALQVDVPDRPAHDAELESLRSERDALERELRRTTELADSVAITEQDVRDVLPPGSAVVDLLVHPRHLPARIENGEVVENGRWSDPVLSAWILRDGEDRVIPISLGPMAPIEEALRDHLSSVVADGANTRGRTLTTEAGTGGGSAALRRLLWEPIAAHIEDASTVFIAADGALGTLPFETIRDADDRFLIEDMAFVYVSDARAIVEMGDEVSELGFSLLAAGGVDYDRVETGRTDANADASRRTTAPAGGAAPRSAELSRGFSGAWTMLPATIPETERIVAMQEKTGPGSALLLLGAEASEERLRAEMPRHAILHLATHGFFQPEGLPSMWAQAQDAARGARGEEMTESAERLTGLHPGLLSGLVLAGANRPPGEGDDREDGYLTASEVTLLDLSNTDLVVLSACETGLGRPQSGEGLLGLRHAFHMAGADTVISSLWSVKDESTSELMQAFYANLSSRGMGRHEALREAQLEMLRRNRLEHDGAALPSTWGAFVLSGEWR